MNTGAVRHVDDLGRVGIPKHIREALNLRSGTRVMLDIDDDGSIRLRAVYKQCAVCGDELQDDETMVKVPGACEMKAICMHCAMDIAQQAGELAAQPQEA